MATSKMVLETKYGNTMSANPQAKGTSAPCFFPYPKKPSPTAPNTNPHNSEDALNGWSRVCPAHPESPTRSRPRTTCR